MLSIEQQFEVINPSIQSILESHESRSRSPIDPVAEMATAAGIGAEHDILKIGPILRESYETRIKALDETGLNFRSVIASSYLINLLTEDNLPHYTHTIGRISDKSQPLDLWLKRWTAEEDAHGVLLRDFGLFSGLIGGEGAIINYDEYIAGRIKQLKSGTDIVITSLAQGFAYTALQEDATKEAHQTEAELFDRFGAKIIRKIAGDEANHQRAYAAMAASLLDAFPDETIVAIRDQFLDFSMPGSKGIPDFVRHAMRIAGAGIFGVDTIVRLQKKQLGPNFWNIENREFATAEAKEAQQELLEDNQKLSTLAMKIEERQERSIEKAKKEGQPLPFILGKTIEIADLRKL